ncbi:MAG: hypothetical protein BZ136_09550 [Methanosphaera sp. rholeuAM74]|nr:MAG: hypothetical protein BZ136_09550 [Methanosphaera sp. rholeuAM74]
MEEELSHSPFQPNDPVNPKKFKGRQEIIKQIDRYIPNARNGIVQHFYLTGKRGMGKTSLANYLLDNYERNHNTIGVHVVNDGIHDIESLLTSIVEILLNKNKTETWYNKLYDGLKDEVKSIGILGNSIEFRPKKETVEMLRTHFATFLRELSEESKQNFIIVIDDVNGLSQTKEFANWYKSLADTLALKDYYGKTRVAFILTSYPDKLTLLHNHNPSFTRIFHQYNLPELTTEEIREFYIDNFNLSNIKLDEDALKSMIYFCSGMPTMMQEIGDAIYWTIDDTLQVSKEKSMQGILLACTNIGRKYLKPVLDNKIKSGNYKIIFEKISELVISEGYLTFFKKDVNKLLTPEESKSLDGFLKRAKELKIIEQNENHTPGEYEFSNKLYPIYFLVQKEIGDKQVSL